MQYTVFNHCERRLLTSIQLSLTYIGLFGVMIGETERDMQPHVTGTCKLRNVKETKRN